MSAPKVWWSPSNDALCQRAKDYPEDYWMFEDGVFPRRLPALPGDAVELRPVSPPPEDVVERCARAASSSSQDEWDQAPQYFKRAWLRIARAVLEAAGWDPWLVTHETKAQPPADIADDVEGIVDWP